MTLNEWLPYAAGAAGFAVHNVTVRRALAKHRKQVNMIIGTVFKVAKVAADADTIATAVEGGDTDLDGTKP